MSIFFLDDIQENCYPRIVIKESRVRKQWGFDKSAFVSAIEGRMQARGLNYRQAADQIGIGFATLWRIKRHSPDFLTVIRICEWLETSLDTFVVRGGR